MTITVPVTKVSIFLRWTSWLIRHALARKHDFVIINCDETMLSNLQCWSHGTFITRARTLRITSTLPACTPRELRMTLLAAITNEPELQNRLPQVFYPKPKREACCLLMISQYGSNSKVHWRSGMDQVAGLLRSSSRSG